MRVGTMFLGSVEQLENESVQTQFFILGAPLFPMQSYYVTAEVFSGVQGFPIPLHIQSVVFGYCRIYLWLSGSVLAVVAYFTSTMSNAVIAAGLLAAAVVSTFVLGGLSASEHRRRTLLKEVTGVGAPPVWLPAELQAGTMQRAEAAWAERGEPMSWEDAIRAGRDDALLLVLAEYSYQPDLASQVLARRA
jgi:hypothetical protein